MFGLNLFVIYKFHMLISFRPMCSKEKISSNYISLHVFCTYFIIYELNFYTRHDKHVLILNFAFSVTIFDLPSFLSRLARLFAERKNTARLYFSLLYIFRHCVWVSKHISFPVRALACSKIKKSFWVWNYRICTYLELYS